MHFAHLLFFASVAITVSARSLILRRNNHGGSDEDCDYSDGCEGNGSGGGGSGDGSNSNGGSGSSDGCNITSRHSIPGFPHPARLTRRPAATPLVASCGSAASEDGVITLDPIADASCISDALQELSDLRLRQFRPFQQRDSAPNTEGPVEFNCEVGGENGGVGAVRSCYGAVA
ncbi:hypothetical protein C8R45DRAFT_946591 [Mycena sanguinolenta]|nr:hypothetical protein C8R45DRAFT_946591 [Mycena sanguinolenta]